VILPGFGGPDIAVPPPPPPVPTPEDPEVLEARRRQRAADLQRRGRASTILAEPKTDALGNIAQPRAGALTLG